MVLVSTSCNANPYITVTPHGHLTDTVTSLVSLAILCRDISLTLHSLMYCVSNPGERMIFIYKLWYHAHLAINQSKVVLQKGLLIEVFFHIQFCGNDFP